MSNLVKINLRDFYPWYTHDEYAEVPEVIAAELFTDRRYEKNHERAMRRNNVLSLDAEDGTNEAASILSSDNPEIVFGLMERCCRLCRALNSLPEKQGRRVDARYLQGMSVQEIAEAENVSESSVKESIDRGLKAMRKIL